MIQCLFTTLYSQNNNELINNGGFELFDSIPNNVNQLEYSTYWINPINTADYFNSLSTDYSVGVPYNYGGYKEPYRGKSYAAISTFDVSYGYQEYIQTRLKEKMQKDTTYEIAFSISLAEKSYYNPLNIISYAFTDSNLISNQENSDFCIFRDNKGFSMLGCVLNTTIKYDSLVIKDSIYNWITIKSLYKAIGKESYLTIGVFQDDVSKWKHFCNKFLKKKQKKNFSFDGNLYYIDEISVKIIDNKQKHPSH